MTPLPVLDFSPVLVPPVRPPCPESPVFDTRQVMLAARRESCGRPGVYLDRSTTGSGKTYACLTVLAERLPRPGLVVVRTHLEAGEIVRDYRHLRRLPVIAYVQRTVRALKRPIVCPYCGIVPPGPPERGCRYCRGTGSIEGFVSCWNPEADAAEAAGFSVVAAVCPGCPYRKRCQTEGYLFLNERAEGAPIAVATHTRIQKRGFAKVAIDRHYVSVQEDAIEVLRPLEESGIAALEAADPLFSWFFADPRRLDWLAAVEAEGKGPSVDAFVRRLAHLSRSLLALAKAATEPVVVFPLPEGLPRPGWVERLLWEVGREHRVRLSGNIFRILLAAAEGALHSLVLFRPSHYDQVYRGRKPPERPCDDGLRLLGVCRNEPPDQATTWFCDATMPVWRLAAATGRPPERVIEPADLPLRKVVIRVSEDVTQRTGKATVRRLVREALARFPHRTRAGVLCHSRHKEYLNGLEPPFRARIAKVEHFRGGTDRGSNGWHRSCDLLIVLGTPRLPRSAIVKELIRLGEFEAAKETPEWGVLEEADRPGSGAGKTPGRRGYGHPRWQAVYDALVVANLRQAVGRARATLEEGIDAVVFSDEEIGVPVVDPFRTKLAKPVARLFAALCVQSRNKSLLRSRTHPGGAEEGIPGLLPITTAELAKKLKIVRTSANKLLRQAEAAGLIERIGQRGGWMPAPEWRSPN